MYYLTHKQKKQLVAAGATMLVGYITKAALAAIWRGIAKNAPPAKPASPDVPVAEAVLWTLASTLTVSLASLAANRLAETWMGDEGQLTQAGLGK